MIKSLVVEYSNPLDKEVGPIKGIYRLYQAVSGIGKASSSLLTKGRNYHDTDQTSDMGAILCVSVICSPLAVMAATDISTGQG
jgi:hypothetical protein